MLCTSRVPSACPRPASAVKLRIKARTFCHRQASSVHSMANKLLWFRKGLRLHDNPALLEACSGAGHMYPIFILDPYFVSSGKYKCHVNRYNFLLESLKDLDSSLQARGSRLLVLRGTPEEVLPRVVKDWNIAQLCFEVDTEPYAKDRDARIKRLMEAAGVECKSFWSHTLYNTDVLVERAGGKAPLTYTAFTKLVDAVGTPPAPAADPPQVLPPPQPGAPGTELQHTQVPTWQEAGFTRAPTTIFPGGETEGLKRLAASFTDTAWVAGFQKPDTDPSAFLKPATTVLSPYLKFGCVSARLFHQKLLEVYAKHPKHSQPPQSLRGQLLWREFFYTVGAHTPNFDKMVGNPICKQIPWEESPERLAAWREARTGYPWIDACMTQLRTWGWMHHLARHSVACFLTRGDLYCSWEAGKEVFEEYLIDQDHYINAANWMWLSASCFFNQYFRVYSPISFGRKYDPNGNFIRHFLPVLKDFPAKYIYEPWTAPSEVQRKAGCVIGKDYPHPIVDHAEASKACMSKMAAAYKANREAAAGSDGEEVGGSKSRPKAASKASKAAASSKPVSGNGSKRQKTLEESGMKTVAK